MAQFELEIGQAEFEILLKGKLEYMGPERILDGLSAEDACARLEGSPHTIAELVWHMHYWQQDQLAVLRGGENTRPADFELGVSDFKDVAPGEWEQLRADFLASYTEMISAAGDPELVRRAPDEKYNLGFLLANHAIHNAYHFGQVMQLRRMQGNWDNGA